MADGTLLVRSWDRLMPRSSLVDGHVHLYDPATIRYTWMAEHEALDRAHGPSDFDETRGPVEVEAVVLVEVGADPGQHLAEARWLQAVTDADPRFAAIVASAPIERGAAVRDDLRALSALPAVRGIRRLIQDEPPGFCLRPDFIAGIALLADIDLPFDLCIHHGQLRDAIRLVERCPGVRFVLDHLGKPGIRDGLLDPWRSDLAELARLPNVMAKLSGVITEAGPDWTPELIRPYLDHALSCFGPERLMFGSDWTVAKLTHAYPLWVDLVEDLTGADTPARTAIFQTNARTFYRLP